MGQQPSVPTDLSRGVRVIGAGFSRTGTVSFAMALEKLLQGPVWHGGNALFMREEEHIRQWIKIQDSNDTAAVKSTLRELTAGYVALTDTPAVHFTGELAEIYPNALVICQTRDPESWYRSARDMYKYTSLWYLDVLFFPIPTLRYFGQWRRSISAKLERHYGIPTSQMDNPGLITMHEDYVRRVVPKERLFFFNVKDGWEPLCKILNCPVPDEPFPRANDKDEMREFFEKLVAQALAKWVQVFAVSGVAAAAGWYAWKNIRSQ